MHRVLFSATVDSDVNEYSCHSLIEKVTTILAAETWSLLASTSHGNCVLTASPGISFRSLMPVLRLVHGLGLEVETRPSETETGTHETET